MKEKKKLIIITAIVLVVMLATIGITFAMFMYRETGETSKLVLGDIWMKYTEIEGISLQNALPGDPYSDYFEFTITGTNTYKEKDIWYDVILSNGEVPEGKEETNRIDSRYLKFKLVEVISETEEKVLFEDKTYNDLNNRRVYVSTIPKNTTNEYNKTYRMYMTINERLQIGNTSNSIMTMDEYKNVFASVKVSVTGDFNSKQMPGTMARLGTSSTKFWSDDIENVKANIKEVNFVQLDNSEIDARYNAASIKSDVTTMEEYPIKVWLEVNETDSTMYTMYVASEEEIYFPSKSAYMFYAFNSLEKITFENIDTSQTTTMQRMFSNSASLTEINGLEKFDTSKFSPYDGFNAMFLGCSSLTNLNLSFFDVSNAKNLSFMFDGCSSLTSLNLNSWNTSNVDNISGMFEGCSSLVTLNLSNFSTEKVTQSRNVFNGCVKLKTLDISNFVYNSLTSAFTYENMFANVGSNLPEGTYTTVYVKPDYVLNGKSYSPQSWILNLTGTNRPSGWSTSNVIVKQ